MQRHLQISTDISKASEGDESRGCPFREGRQEKQEKKKKTKVPEESQTGHKNVSASFGPDIILSLRKAVLHGEYLARIVAS